MARGVWIDLCGAVLSGLDRLDLFDKAQMGSRIETERMKSFVRGLLDWWMSDEERHETLEAYRHREELYKCNIDRLKGLISDVQNSILEDGDVECVRGLILERYKQWAEEE